MDSFVLPRCRTVIPSTWFSEEVRPLCCRFFKPTLCVVLLMVFVCAPVRAVQREEVEIPANGGRALSSVLFLPDRKEPAPAVIVLHTAFDRTVKWLKSHLNAR